MVWSVASRARTVFRVTAKSRGLSTTHRARHPVKRAHANPPRGRHRAHLTNSDCGSRGLTYMRRPARAATTTTDACVDCLEHAVDNHRDLDQMHGPFATDELCRNRCAIRPLLR